LSDSLVKKTRTKIKRHCFFSKFCQQAVNLFGSNDINLEEIKELKSAKKWKTTILSKLKTWKQLKRSKTSAVSDCKVELEETHREKNFLIGRWTGI